MIKARTAKFQIGQIVRHRVFSFRGVIFDIDPEFNNTEEWWLSIPENVRPHKDQPFYHLLAENSESEYVAYVSEQNLLPDESGEPIRHSQVAEIFVKDKSGGYRPRNPSLNCASRATGLQAYPAARPHPEEPRPCAASRRIAKRTTPLPSFETRPEGRSSG